MIYQASTSVQTGSLEEGYKVTWHFATYWDALSEYWPQFLRSVAYAASATVLCLVLGYPLAYLIAFRAGRWRNLIMILVIAPFFTSFLIRTLAWKTILADGGPVVGALNTLHVLDVTSWLGWTAGDRVLATPRGGLRSDVQLPALHDPAAVHVAGAHRRSAARGGGGPVPRGPPRSSGRSPSRCRCRASSPKPCSPSSRRPATTSTRPCWVPPTPA